MQMITLKWQKMRRNQKASWWEWKEGWRSWLKTLHSKNQDHGIQSYHFMANRWGKNGNSERLYFWGGSKITADGDCSHEIKRYLLPGRKAMTNLDSILKSRDITLPTKVLCSQSYGFPSSQVWTWELNHKQLSTKELMLLNCGAREDSWESLGQ